MINDDGTEPLIGIAAYHAGGHGWPGLRLFQIELRFKRGQALPGILGCGQFSFKLRVFFAQVLVFFLRPAQRKIVVPGMADA